MTHWQTKSESNILAANNLKESLFYASSVHCSYYSCIQLMYHILSSHFGKTDEQISLESKVGGKSDSGLHNWLINQMVPGFNNKYDGNKFSGTIRAVQRLRVKSDYLNLPINVEEAIKAKNEANSALTLLIRNFKI